MPPSADTDGLTTASTCHRLVIPFENLDVRLGRGISLDPDHVSRSSSTSGGAAIASSRTSSSSARSFDRLRCQTAARPGMAGPDGIPPETHTVNLVRIDGDDWIADAGFGGSYWPPMKLSDGSAATGPTMLSSACR